MKRGSEMKAILQMIKSEFPDKAIDISESMQLLQEMINNIMEDISNKINTAFQNRDFDNVNKYQKIAENIHLYEKKIEEIIDILDIENTFTEGEIDEDTERKLIPNYADYIVDHNIEHSLYENLTHKRPFAVKSKLVCNFPRSSVNPLTHPHVNIRVTITVKIPNV